MMMKRQNMIWVFGILSLCLVAAVAFGERPSRMPTSRGGSKGMAGKPGTLSRAHLSSPNSRTSRPSTNLHNNRSSLSIPKSTQESRKSPNTRFNSPTKIKKSFQSSREDKESMQKDRNRPESRERFSRHDSPRENRDHDRRPYQYESSHWNNYRTRYIRPDYRPRYSWRRDRDFSISIGTNWDWSSYDSFDSNYIDSGLSWGISYGSDDYAISITSGNPTYVSTYQVWISGRWDTVYDRVTDIGLNGIVCWRYSSRNVWIPGYWKVCYR